MCSYAKIFWFKLLYEFEAKSKKSMNLDNQIVESFWLGEKTNVDQLQEIQ